MAASLTENGIGQAHLVGHSLGGGIALLIAAGMPDRTASLSLIAPAGLGCGIDKQFLTEYPDTVIPETMIELLRKLVHRPQFINKMTVQRALTQLGRDGARDALRAVAAAITPNEPEIAAAAEMVVQSDIPRMTIWGEADKINPLDRHRLQEFGGACNVVPETGHLPHIENPKVVNRLLVDFLAQQMAV